MTNSPPTGWKYVARPASLFRRFEFSGYAETSAFLDALAKISEETGLFPDLGFGTSHVNVTIHCTGDQTGNSEPTAAETEFANRANGIDGAAP